MKDHENSDLKKEIMMDFDGDGRTLRYLPNWCYTGIFVCATNKKKVRSFMNWINAAPAGVSNNL